MNPNYPDEDEALSEALDEIELLKSGVEAWKSRALKAEVFLNKLSRYRTEDTRRLWQQIDSFLEPIRPDTRRDPIQKTSRPRHS